MRPEETKHGNTRVIKVRFLGPTDTRGSRVKLIEQRYNITDSVTLSYDYRIANVLEQAVQYLKNIGINVLGYGSDNDNYYVFSDSWAFNNDFININHKNN